jgi:hypothetical protein
MVSDVGRRSSPPNVQGYESNRFPGLDGLARSSENGGPVLRALSSRASTKFGIVYAGRPPSTSDDTRLSGHDIRLSADV